MAIVRRRLEPAGNPRGENDFLPAGVDYISIETVDDWQEVATENRHALRAKYGSLMRAYERLRTNGAVRVDENGGHEVSIYLMT